MNLIIFLFHTDASGLKEPEHVRDSQEKVVQALQQYTTAQYPSIPSKFGELLLRMPELHRVCQVCKLFPGLITQAVFITIFDKGNYHQTFLYLFSRLEKKCYVLANPLMAKHRDSIF